MALVETTNLTQRLGGRDILTHVNLTIERGESFVIIGPTGAGKTTLLKLLDLLDTPANGTVFFDGIDVTLRKGSRLEARRRMSYVQQKPAVFNMSVYDNIACGLRWRKERSAAIERKVSAALELVGMEHYAQRHARTLSGGETQRIAIARALVTQPELLLLDEPTANLDPVSASRIEEILERIISEHRTTVFMATHDMLQGQRLASRMGVLIGGTILQTGSPGEVFGSPSHREVAEFVGIDNILAGTVSGKDDSLTTIAIDPGGGTLQAISDFPLGEKVYAMVKPDDVTLALMREPSSARNTYGGKVTDLIPAGPLSRVKVNCGFPLQVLVTRKSAEEMGLSPGREVYASFKATAVRTIKHMSVKI